MASLTVRAPLAWLGPGRVIRDAVVRCDGGLVAEVGEAGLGESGAAPEAAGTELSVDGFLMPAVADRHVHIGMADPAAVLLGGVTAVRDLAWPPDEIFSLAAASELPTYNGPLVRAAGPMLTGRGRYPTLSRWAPPGTGRELDGPDDGAAAVRELGALGATLIKVSLNVEAGPTPSDGELAAVVETAHLLGLPVTAHCEGAGQVERAVGAGIDEVAHTPWTERVPDHVVDAAARTMRWVSTLDIHSYGNVTPELRLAAENLAQFRAAGGRIVYGTDLGNGPIPPGIHVREALLLNEAVSIGAEDVLDAMVAGPLETGAAADLVAFGSNPVEDLRALGDLRLVIRGGRVAFLA